MTKIAIPSNSITFIDQLNKYMDRVTYLQPEFKEIIPLSVISSIAGRRIMVEDGPYLFYPNEYFLFVGESGCGKETAIEYIIGRMLKEVKPDIVYKLTSFTEAKLFQDLAKQPHLIGLNEEIGDMQGADWMKPLFPALTQLYNTTLDSVGRGTKTQGEDIVKNHYLVLNWGIQDETMGNLFSDRLLNMGFISRWLIPWSKSALPRSTDTHRQALKDWNLSREMLLAINTFLDNRNPIILTLTDEAKEMYVRYVSRKKMESYNSSAGMYLSRIKDHVIKLSTLFWLNRNIRMAELNVDDVDNVSNVLNVDSVDSVESVDNVDNVDKKSPKKGSQNCIEILRKYQPSSTRDYIVYVINVIYVLESQDIENSIYYLENLIPKTLDAIEKWGGSEQLRLYKKVEYTINRLVLNNKFINNGDGNLYVVRRDVVLSTGILGRKLDEIVKEHISNDGIILANRLIVTENAKRPTNCYLVNISRLDPDVVKQCVPVKKEDTAEDKKEL